MQTTEIRLAVIHIIFSLTQIKINDIDGIHFPDFTVGIPQTDIFGYRLRHPVKYPVEIVQLPIVLHLDD